MSPSEHTAQDEFPGATPHTRRSRRTHSYGVRNWSETHTHAGFIPEYTLWISKIKICVEDLNGVSKFKNPGERNTARAHAKEFLESEFAEELIELLNLRSAMQRWKTPSPSGRKHNNATVLSEMKRGRKRGRKKGYKVPSKDIQEKALFKVLGIVPEK
jgi:hypothetical protein